MSVTLATPQENLIELTWSDDKSSKYHNIWLRDNCHCSNCYYTLTKQRLLNSALINPDIKPKSIQLNDTAKNWRSLGIKMIMFRNMISIG